MPIKVLNTRRVRQVFVQTSARHGWQITRNTLILHSEEMLSNRTDLCVVMSCVQRVSILESKSVRVIDEYVAIRYIMHEQTPEKIAGDHWVWQALPLFDYIVERLQ